MAYINAEKVAVIRKKLKETFPEIKFSVRKNAHSSTVYVDIMKSPYEFRPADKTNIPSGNVNQYWLDEHGYQNVQILKKIIEICNEGNYNNSDIQADYFDVGWYVDIGIGKWDKPFELITPTKTYNNVSLNPSYTV